MPLVASRHRGLSKNWKVLCRARSQRPGARLCLFRGGARPAIGGQLLTKDEARRIAATSFWQSLSAKTCRPYFAPRILSLTHLSTSVARLSSGRPSALGSISIQQSSEARCCVRGCGAASVAGASVGYPIRISLTVGSAARICEFEEAYSLFGNNAPIIFADTFGSAAQAHSGFAAAGQTGKLATTPIADRSDAVLVETFQLKALVV